MNTADEIIASLSTVVGKVHYKDGTVKDIGPYEDDVEILEQVSSAYQYDSRVTLVWFETDGPGYDWDAESSSWQRRLF